MGLSGRMGAQRMDRAFSPCRVRDSNPWAVPKAGMGCAVGAWALPNHRAEFKRDEARHVMHALIRKHGQDTVQP